MAIKHAKVSAKPDGGDSSLVQASDWNDDHTIDPGSITAAMLASTTVTPGAYTSANITVDAQGRITAAANGVGGGGIGGTGTAEYLAKFTGAATVDEADDFYYTPFNNQWVVEKRLLVAVDLNEATVSGGDPSLTISTGGTGLTAHDGGAQSFNVANYNLDVGSGGAPSAISQGFLAAAEATKTGAGPLINSAFVATAGNGTDNYSFQGVSGVMRNNQAVVFGDSLTVGSGAAAASGEVLLHANLTIDNGQVVTLGNNVVNFVVPGSAVLSPCIAIGATATAAAAINTKNMVPGQPDTGVQCLLDTTVTAGARGGFVAYRGAGGGFGGAKQLGLVYAGANDNFIVGATADDVCIFNTAPAKRLLLGSDGTGFTVGASLNGAGQLAARSLMTGDPTAGTGAKWTSGTGTPEGTVVGNKGDLFSRTDGGASTCLYVKESTGGNTGWVAK